jgi:CRP-like cAMP-binding protein
LRKFSKGEIVISQGEICKELLFINSGLARGYILGVDGKDRTWSIYFNDKNSNMTNLFLVEYDSFLHQKPSSISIEILEESEVIVSKFEDIQTLYNLKKGERFGRYMAEEAYSFLHNMILDRQTKSAKERFEIFMVETPHLLEKVPQYHIATYLGITPQHLSRLKSLNSHLTI